ncbi:MAG: TIGR03560 family F420-dependent LLM class oxidoreductase [Deltaproteobacteria bacterium]|jgi:F420-dependent oxidoreductase-like protein|nr:TIGR03560 family F420-dependent LLM class oxidoreductase [Deltaproteobacteria bacterium]
MSITFGLSGSGISDYQLGSGSWDFLLDMCRRAEDQGFDTYYVADHLNPVSGRDPYGECVEAWTMLAALAAATKRIRLGTMVTGATYRHPAVLAKMATMVDIVSGGRLEFGIGTGWSRGDHDPFGIPFPPFADRVAALDEQLAATKLLWTERNTTFSGKYVSMKDAAHEPKPCQKPHPPILIGGSSDRTLRVAARHADIWNGLGTPAYVAERMTTLDRLCTEEGRNPADVRRTWWTPLKLTDDEAEADAYVEAQVANMRATTPTENLRHRYATSDASLEENTRNAMLVGTPAQVRKQIEGFLDRGINGIILHTPPYEPDELARFAREVIPEFRN